MITQGVDGKTFYIGDSKAENGRVYGLVNIAAFLAMSVADSIRKGSCDELNSDVVGGLLPISNACGQYGVSYQDLTCPDDLACEVDATMRSTASPATSADGSGEHPPTPFYCAPKSDYGDFTGYWDYLSNAENRDAAAENALGRTDVEG